MHTYMQGHPPQQQHFQDKRIPAHVTFAHKEGVRIARNDDFYELKNGTTKTVDLLFLIASAPVATGALPEAGSEPYAGLAIAMQLAMEELSREFPPFFDQETKTPNRCGMQDASA